MIKILPSDLVNQIAAGEVIERPASVIKELVENSIDAGSSKIDVFVKNGGTSYICIKDNGSGMSSEDLDLCIQRHATSKLMGKNLLDVHTFGFRGEALPSICSISRVEVKTRRPDDALGWVLGVDGGDVVQKAPINIEVGTIISVRDLFFKTPARLKFLKSTSSELAACSMQVKLLALSNPNVAFSFVNGEKIVFSYESVGNSPLLRVKDVLGTEFYENGVFVQQTCDGIECTGLASCPTYHKNDGQYIFINKRPVKDRALAGAIKVAYQRVLIPGEQPSYVLFLTIDPQEVDVNVHPAKTEVRFRNAGKVRSFLISVLEEALSKSQKTSTTLTDKFVSSMQKENSFEWRDDVIPRGSAGTYKEVGVDGNTLVERREEELRSIEEEYSAAPIWRPSEEPNPQKNATFAGTEEPYVLDGIFSTPQEGQGAGAHDRQEAGAPGRSNIQDPRYASTPSRENSRFGLEQVRILFGNEDVHRLGTAKAQIFDSFIISQSDDDIFLIDQHAAHERIVYEQIEQHLSINENGLVTWSGFKQQLMFPVDVDIANVNYADVASHLSQMGFKATENAHGNVITITAIPKICESLDTSALVQSIIGEIMYQSDQSILLANVHKIFATHACHNSVRANHPLNHAEMDALLRQMEQTKRSEQCNHGRPAYVRLSRKEIERLFERTGL